MDKQDWLKFYEMQALWWMHAASNGHAATKTIHKDGLDGPLMTAEELRDDAMETSQRHMKQYMEIANWTMVKL